jgi:hypothetical protein
MQKRRRFKQSLSLKERLFSFAKEMRKKASQLPPGSERDDALKRARSADTATRVEQWLNSPGR